MPQRQVWAALEGQPDRGTGKLELDSRSEQVLTIRDGSLTDARTNLYTAITAVEQDIKGVTVAFNRKIIRGTRAVKVSTHG